MTTPIQSPPSPLQQPETWTATAAGYAEMVAMGQYSEKALSLVGVRATDHVIDIATGPGTLAFLTAPRVARVTAIDFSSGMIEQLARRAAREGFTNVEGMVMD